MSVTINLVVNKQMGLNSLYPFTDYIGTNHKTKKHGDNEQERLLFYGFVFGISVMRGSYCRTSINVIKLTVNTL